MKRSEINRIMEKAKDFLADMKFCLPPFAFWSPAEWVTRGPACAHLVREQLGWDITDFGLGDFDRHGLFLFTLRNGTLEGVRSDTGKSYAEKIMIVQEDQVTPTHFHMQKMEDIINRGGGNLVVRLWNATDHDDLAGSRVLVRVDSMEVAVPAGETIVLHPGESVSLPQRLYHRFWGERGSGPTLVGEVSRVNDDRIDNHFHERVGRFPRIDEDEPPLHLLVGDYASSVPVETHA